MRFIDTVCVSSIEGFLTGSEVIGILEEFSRIEVPAEPTYSRLHAVPGLTIAESSAIYEPRGRIDITILPDKVNSILREAEARALPSIRRLLPTVTGFRPWTYVEYGAGQYITPHVDGVAEDSTSRVLQVAGIGIMLSHADGGGDFYVETCSGPLWRTTPGSQLDGRFPEQVSQPDADSSADWFAQLPKTQWRTRQSPGSAVLYGSQLPHGTHPVIKGRCRKLLSWLVQED